MANEQKSGTQDQARQRETGPQSRSDTLASGGAQPVNARGGVGAPAPGQAATDAQAGAATISGGDPSGGNTGSAADKKP